MAEAARGGHLLVAWAVPQVLGVPPVLGAPWEALERVWAVPKGVPKGVPKEGLTVGPKAVPKAVPKGEMELRDL